MTANTPKGFPYPVGTDRVMDGDDAIRALATAVDTKVGLVASGQITLTLTGNDVPTTAVVTLPAGLFSIPPYVTAALRGRTDPQNWYSPTVAGQSDGASFSVSAARRAGSANCIVAWIASQTG